MFKYNSSNKLEVPEVYCLLCTSVISSLHGWDMNYEKTELDEKDSVISQYYRTYHSLISGTFDYKKKEYTTGGLTLDNYWKDYHEPASRRYNEMNDCKTDEETFAFLSDFDKFYYIFRYYLVPQICAVMEKKLISENGISSDKAKDYSKGFWSEFHCLFKYKIDEFVIKSSSKTDLWKYLYLYAVDMPNVIVGVLKSISSSDPMFFRYNKGNFDSVLIYIKDRIDEVKFTNYKDKLRIAGILVDAWKNFFLPNWKGTFAGVISAGNNSFIDSEGVIQYYNDTYDDMFAGGVSLDIPKFNELMTDIAKGSYWYKVGKVYHYNLIAWRQNEIRKSIIDNLNNDGSLVSILDKLDLTVGKYESARDISDHNGKANNDKTTRFEYLNSMIKEVYYNFIDESHAKFYVDKWYKDFDDKSVMEGKTDGKYPMDNKFKGMNHVRENKRTYNELIKGVNALKALEASVMRCGYSFMSFPDVTMGAGDYELAYNLSLSDYLDNNVLTGLDEEIEYDIDCGDEIYGCRSIINLVELDSKILLEMTKQNPVNKIKLDSIVGSNIAFNFTDKCDQDLCSLLSSEGISADKLELNQDSLYSSVIDELSNSVDKSWGETFLNVGGYVNSIREYNSPELKDAEKKSVLKNKILLTQYRYFAKLISVFALKGDLTHGMSEEWNNNRQYGHVDVNGNMVNMIEIGNHVDDVTKSIIEQIYEESISDEAFEEMKSKYFVRETIYNYLVGSEGFSSSTNWYPNAFIKISPDGKKSLDRLVKMFEYLCSPINIDAEKRKDITMEGYLNSRGLSFVNVLENLCSNFNNLSGMFSNDKSAEDLFTLPRLIALGININVVCEHISMLFLKLYNRLTASEDVSSNSNSDDFIDISVVLNALTVLTQMEILKSYTNKIDELSLYEEQFQTVFSALDYVKGSGGFDRKSDNNYYDFVFMDNAEFIVKEFSDLDERLFQYRCATAFVKKLVNNRKLWCVNFANKKYTLNEFVRFVKRVVSIKRDSTNYEYHTDMIPRNPLDSDLQNRIVAGMKRFLSDNTEYLDCSDYVWIDNIIQYCKSNNCKLNNGIISDIRVRLNEYVISDNDAKLISLNGSVLHKTIIEREKHVIYFASAYGIFSFYNGIVRECREMEDFSWLC